MFKEIKLLGDDKLFKAF